MSIDSETLIKIKELSEKKDKTKRDMERLKDLKEFLLKNKKRIPKIESLELPFVNPAPKRFNPKRDKDGNRIPFVNPEPKRFNPKRDKDGNRIPFDPKTGIQLLNKGGEVKKYKHGGSVNKKAGRLAKRGYGAAKK